MLHRRSFLVGLLATPAIVHAGNLMPVRALARSLATFCSLPEDAGWITHEKFADVIHHITPEESPFYEYVKNGGILRCDDFPFST